MSEAIDIRMHAIRFSEFKRGRGFVIGGYPVGATLSNSISVSNICRRIANEGGGDVVTGEYPQILSWRVPEGISKEPIKNFTSDILSRLVEFVGLQSGRLFR